MTEQLNNSEALAQWDDVFMNTYGAPLAPLVSGRGATVVDADGNKYVDMLAGIAVNSLGHAHPTLVEAVSSQVHTLGHISNFFASKPALATARLLRERFADPRAKVFFCNSGAEANETAFKLTRLTGRAIVLSAIDGFHGRTMGSLSLTGQPSKREPFAPLVPGVEYYRYGDIDHVRELVDAHTVNGDCSVAAIFLEPIQGEVGVVPAPEGFLQAIRQLCDERGILMVVDEVQTGVGRTGDFFAHTASGVRPDIVTMAKGLAGGMPIGAVIAREDVAGLFTPGAHGTTFGGNPVSCAAAHAVLDTLDDGFLAEVVAKGERLAADVGKLPGVDHVRGRGLMLGVVLERPVAKEAVKRGLERGVILNAPTESVIRLTPPLVISNEEITTAVQGLADALMDILGPQDNEGE